MGSVPKLPKRIEVYECSASDPACVRLLERLDAYLAELYPPEENHPMTVAELLEPAVTFVAARADGEVVGCGALVRRGKEYVEIKRMYVVPGVRGQGVARRVMEYLQARASAEGYRLFRAESGTRQPEALALYERFGYCRIGPFGDYEDNPSSVFLEKRLPPAMP